MLEENNNNTENEENIIPESKDTAKELETKIEELQNKLLRAVAETENLRKRHKEELDKTYNYCLTNFATDLIPVIESLYLATENMPATEIAKDEKLTNFAKGVVMTRTEMLKTLEKYGIKRLDSLGEKFDPDYHQAVSHVESDEKEGIIVQVIQEGYMIMNRLLKPALVSVSKKKN